MPAKFQNDYIKIVGRIQERRSKNGYFKEIEVVIHVCNRSSSPILENIIKSISMIDRIRTPPPSGPLILNLWYFGSFVLSIKSTSQLERR